MFAESRDIDFVTFLVTNLKKNNTGARLLGSIYCMTLKLIINCA